MAGTAVYSLFPRWSNPDDTQVARGIEPEPGEVDVALHNKAAKKMTLPVPRLDSTATW